MVLEKLSGPRNEYLETPVRNVAQKASGGGLPYIVLVPAGPMGESARYELNMVADIKEGCDH